MWKWILFLVGSAGILWLSWASLRNPRTHGFFRFFAFEGIIGLILLNIGDWFRDPFALRQIVSWLLLLASLLLAGHGFYLLRVIGKPSDQWENTTKVVRVGAYRFIRHPLYCSLLLLEWGAYLKHPSLFGSALVLAVTGFLVATAKVEEVENLHKFGSAYADYMRGTRMFIPFLF